MTAIEVWSKKSAFQVYGSRNRIGSAILFKLDHVGDFILALDAIVAFRSRFPEASLCLVCAPWNLQIAQSLGIFDEIVTVQFFDARAEGGRKDLTPDLIAALPKRHFDLAVDLRIDPDTRVFLDHVDATHVCGYESPFVERRLSLTLPWTLPSDADGNLGVHQALLMLRLVHTVGDFFNMSDDVAALLRRNVAKPTGFDLGFANSKILVLCNTSSGRAAKNWPEHRFRDLLRWLTVEMDVAVLLIGTKDQAAEAERIINHCNSHLIASAVGRTSLPEAIHLIDQASLFIGNDSGLTHIAARLGVPTIDILSGIDPSAMWAPIGPDVTAVKAPVPCSPCHILALSQCRHDHQCIENITLSFVQVVVRRKLLSCKVRPIGERAKGWISEAANDEIG